MGVISSEEAAVTNSALLC